MMKNKRGYSFAGWTEVFAIGAFLLIAIGLIVVGFNDKYSQNNDPSFGMGLQDNANAIVANLSGLQQSFQSGVGSGNANFATIFGLTLSTSYEMIKAGLNLVWIVFSGGWILKAVALMHLPIVLGTIFQMLYLISGGWILLQILFRTIGKP